ncbi:MAG: T9SS type A sorting domain-containing protein, partial [Chitinispirillales bacterium]|nr:T9SS type A sorting domain-containing protein [Chitinispirillales bacterium]
GNLLPAEDTEILGGAVLNIERTRREHSHLTVGMWAAAAMASGGPALAESYSDELLKFYKGGTNYWGYAVDPLGGTEDTAHNEMYFDQFLAWFGASMLGGVFTNVWEDLRDGIPEGPPEWRKRPELSIRDIDASNEPLRVTGSFTRGVRWTATFKHDSTGRSVSYSASSDSVDLIWYGLSETGAHMPQGFYTLTVDAPGLDSPYSGKLWLGKSYDLMRGNRLLVDDFADGDVIPYIGKEWTSFLDSHFGVQGASTATVAVNKESGVNWLHWNYALDQGGLGFNPYAGLDWSCRTSDGSPIDLTGIDTLIIRAKVPSGTLGVSVQIVSSDFSFPGDYQYFSDSISLTTASREFVLPIAAFKQRADGSGKSFATTLQTVTSIRFQVQAASGTTGAIMVESMYFAGDVSKLYAAPPPYVAPPGEIPPDKASHRAYAKPKYSIKRSAGAVRIALPGSMAGASAVVVDARGRVVRRMSVAQNGNLNLSTKGLAKGMYFAEIKKAGAGSLRLPIGNVK